jgi:prepilin-type N-terminal cleavage/methylation domain-containing protein
MKNIFNKMKRGFTLVELLVVIGVIGVLAAGLVAVINPADRIAAANDAKVLGDMSQIIGAINAYAASNNGNFPVVTTPTNSATSWAAPLSLLSNELTTFPAGLPLYTYGATCSATSCKVSVSLKALKNRQNGATTYTYGAACWWVNSTAGTGTGSILTPASLAGLGSNVSQATTQTTTAGVCP